MIIAAAQISSDPNSLKTTIEKHVRWVQKAIEEKVDALIFPELSLTGYTTRFADQRALALPIGLRSLQDLSNASSIYIGLGLPLLKKAGIEIAQLWLQPSQEPYVYAKQCLHKDEEPYFISGTSDNKLPFLGATMAMGICYETTLDDTFATLNPNTSVYLSSAAKTKEGITDALRHYKKMVRLHDLPILCANAVGAADEFQNGGGSCFVHPNLEVMQMNHDMEGLLIWDQVKNHSKIIS